MDKKIKTRIADAINNITGLILTGNRDREKALKNLNVVFQDGFVEGYFPNLCEAEVSVGVPKYKNEFSHPTLKTGLRIVIRNNKNLTKSEIVNYARFFIEDDRLVRGFMVLGFDTLILQPKYSFGGRGIKALQISLKSFHKPGSASIGEG